MQPKLGRHVFGLAAILFGVFTLVWRNFNDWQQILGGITIQFRRSASMAVK